MHFTQHYNGTFINSPDDCAPEQYQDWILGEINDGWLPVDLNQTGGYFINMNDPIGEIHLLRDKLTLFMSEVEKLEEQIKILED